MKIRYLVFTILAVAIGAMVIYRISANKALKKDDKGPKRPQAVSGIVVQPRDFENQLSLSGSIEANESVDVRSEVSGIVEKIYFSEGSRVNKGQPLFKVNDVELRAQLSKARTAQDLASENERRAKLLLGKEAISREEYDIASADFKSAKAETQLIQAQLGKTSVRAPFSGTIGLRSISPGTYVTAETIVAKLVNSSQVKITFSIPEKYATQTQLGATIDFTVAGSKDLYHARVYAIEPEVSVDTRTLKMRALADNPKGRLLPGTFANIMLPLHETKDAIVIPSESVIPIQNGKKVFVADAGKAREVEVETATRTDSEIVVLKGLKAGDTVITTGVMTMKDKAPVKVSVVKNSKP